MLKLFLRTLSCFLLSHSLLVDDHPLISGQMIFHNIYLSYYNSMKPIHRRKIIFMEQHSTFQGNAHSYDPLPYSQYQGCIICQISRHFALGIVTNSRFFQDIRPRVIMYNDNVFGMWTKAVRLYAGIDFQTNQGDWLLIYPQSKFIERKDKERLPEMQGTGVILREGKDKRVYLRALVLDSKLLTISNSKLTKMNDEEWQIKIGRQFCKQLDLSNCFIKQYIHNILKDDFIHLIELNLKNNILNQGNIKQIFSNKFFPALKHLNLSFNSIGSQGLKFVFYSGVSFLLQTLQIQNCKIDDQFCIFQRFGWPRLSKLVLSGNEQINLYNKMVDAIRCSYLPMLDQLYISNCGIKTINTKVRQMIGSLSQQLRVLTLSGNKLTQRDLELIFSFHFHKLQHFSFAMNYIQHQVKLDPTRVPVLKKLNLSNSGTKVAHVLADRQWPIEELNLENNTSLSTRQEMVIILSFLEWGSLKRLKIKNIPLQNNQTIVSRCKQKGVILF